MTLTLRVARAFLADQPPGQRKLDKTLVEPINKLRGINRRLEDNHGKTEAVVDETVSPNRRDILPEDVFHPKPHQIGVLNLVETGKDLSERKVEQDKGYGTVRNLSQYLIETQGGGGTKPVS